jgi:hypothetical protein
VVVATTPLTSFGLVSVGLRIVFALGTARLILSLALVLSIRGFRITILNGSLLFSIMSVGMHFRQRLGTRRALIGVPQKELIVPFCLKQCLDQLRINSKPL